MPFWAKFSLFNPLYGLQLAERELLLFALFWMLLGLVDEVAVDCTWLVLRLSGRAKTPILPAADPQPLNGTIAVFIAAWQEAEVIGATITHMLNVWPQADLRLFVGCYGNDPATIAAKTRTFGFTTDSAHRFERGVDFAATRVALERATKLIVDLCGGKAGAVTEALGAWDSLP